MKKISSLLLVFTTMLFLVSCSKDVVNQGFPEGSSADKGAKAMAQNEFAKAEGHFKDALKGEPSNYDVLNYLAYVQLKQSKLKALGKTIAALKKAHPEKSAGEYYEYRLLKVKNKNQNYEKSTEAVEQISKAIEKSPGHGDYLLYRADTYMSIRKPGLALKDLYSFMELGDMNDFSGQLLTKIFCWYNIDTRYLDDIKKIKDWYAKNKPDEYWSYQIEGCYNLISGNYEEAELVYKNSIKKFKNNLTAHFDLGRVYTIEGLYQRAIDEFEYLRKKEKELDRKTFGKIHLHLALLYHKTRRPAKAWKMVTKAIELRPLEKHYVLWSLDLVDKSGLNADMINNYRDAYKDSFSAQEKADLYFRLATFFLKQGQSKLAIDAAETSLSFNPNFLWSIDLLEQSYRIFEKNIVKAKVYKKRFCSIVGKDNCAKLKSEE